MTTRNCAIGWTILCVLFLLYRLPVLGDVMLYLDAADRVVAFTFFILTVVAQWLAGLGVIKFVAWVFRRPAAKET